MSSLLELGKGRPALGGNIAVGAPAPLPALPGATTEWVVHKPDGTAVKSAVENSSFAGTDQPGIYQVDTAEGSRSFAVNLDPAESNTALLHIETLEQLGCRLANHAPITTDAEQLRQMRSLELENRQKLWRWLILAAIGVLIAETLLAGRNVNRARLAHVEVAST